MDKIKKIFFSQIIVFVLMLSFFFIPFSDTLRSTLFPVFGGLALIFFLLGGTLLLLVGKSRLKGKLRLFLILVGASSVCVSIGIILHNFFYGLFIYLFGSGFWESVGLLDEPFYFFISLVICPIVFLVGVVGSLVEFFKK
ncbi:hypothetical protein K8R33_03880 [archaeon]|nr:hypothetical protein [archaeon]